MYCHCCQLLHTARKTEKPNKLSVLSDAMLCLLQYWMTNIKIYYFPEGFAPVILQRWKPQNMSFVTAPFTETLGPDWSFLWLADIPVAQTQSMPRWCSQMNCLLLQHMWLGLAQHQGRPPDSDEQSSCQIDVFHASLGIFFLIKFLSHFQHILSHFS